MKRFARLGLPSCGLAVLLLCHPGFAAVAEDSASTAPPAAAQPKASLAKPVPAKAAAAGKPAHPVAKAAAAKAKAKAAHKVAAAKKPAPVKTAAAASPRPAAAKAPGGVAVARNVAPPRSGNSARPTPLVAVSGQPAPPAAAPIAVPAVLVTPTVGTGATAATIKAATAPDFVAKFLDDAFRIARAADVSPLQRRAQLSELFTANMDAADLAVHTTGERLNAQPADFQRKFREILISYLVETYYPKIEAASDRTVALTVKEAPPLSDGTAVVWTTFTKEGWGSQSVKWHLATAGGTYKVLDTFTGGVSLVELERDTFQSVMRNGGVSGLMARLDARTRELAMAAPQ